MDPRYVSKLMKYLVMSYSTFKMLKNAKKAKCDRPTDRQTDRPTDRHSVLQSRVHATKNGSGYISVNMTLGPSGSLVSESVFETLKHHSNGLNKKKPGTFWDYASSRTTFVIIQPKNHFFCSFVSFFARKIAPYWAFFCLT